MGSPLSKVSEKYPEFVEDLHVKGVVNAWFDGPKNTFVVRSVSICYPSDDKSKWDWVKLDWMSEMKKKHPLYVHFEIKEDDNKGCFQSFSYNQTTHIKLCVDQQAPLEVFQDAVKNVYLWEKDPLLVFKQTFETLLRARVASLNLSEETFQEQVRLFHLTVKVNDGRGIREGIVRNNPNLRGILADMFYNIVTCNITTV